MSVIEDVAAWTSMLSIDEIPGRVSEIARHQAVSVLAAVHSGVRCSGGRAVEEAASRLGAEGPCSAYPGGRASTLDPALLQNCSLSMSQDYDDYLFLGHTGHSAVLASMAVGEKEGAGRDDVLAAQVAANEVAGRLGGSVVLGPHNGQMWAHIHLLGAAAAASRILGLGPDETADAMGIALSEPVYPLFPGFMGPTSKLLTAAVPTITGVNAAYLAAAGMTGSRSILEDPQGFWAHFAFVPLPFMMTGLGESWVTDTIAFKPYPGCAYIDTAMDALFGILDEFSGERGRSLQAEEVSKVRVEASLLTVAMDNMSRDYFDPSRLSPTNINFSLSVSLAIGLLSGELTGSQLTEEYLDANREAIVALAGRVELVHAADLTVDFLRSMDRAVDLSAMLAGVEVREVVRARHRLRQHLKHVATMGRSEAVSSWRGLDPMDRAFLKALASPLGRRGRMGAYDLGGATLEKLEMPFGARVRLLLKDGTVLEAEKRIPRGGPGDPGRLEVPAEKFLRETAPALGEEGAADALRTLVSGDGTLAEVREALIPAGKR